VPLESVGCRLCLNNFIIRGFAFWAAVDMVRADFRGLKRCWMSLEAHLYKLQG